MFGLRPPFWLYGLCGHVKPSVQYSEPTRTTGCLFPVVHLSIGTGHCLAPAYRRNMGAVCLHQGQVCVRMCGERGTACLKLVCVFVHLLPRCVFVCVCVSLALFIALPTGMRHPIAVVEEKGNSWHCWDRDRV